jgi:hypothetical protein
VVIAGAAQAALEVEPVAPEVVKPAPMVEHAVHAVAEPPPEKELAAQEKQRPPLKYEPAEHVDTTHEIEDVEPTGAVEPDGHAVHDEAVEPPKELYVLTGQT